MSAAFQLYHPTLKKRYIPKNNKTELAIHRRVCQYLKVNFPNVIFHSDFAAGLHLTEHQASVNKSIQSGAGFPDITILHPSRGYHGLFIELKADGTPVILRTGQNKGKLTSNPHIRLQASVLRQLNNEGYYANFAVGYNSAIKIIEWYFCRPQNASLLDDL
jgi:hypothetical protein